MLGWLLNLGFAGSGATVTSPWVTTTTIQSTWFTTNTTIQTTWDTGLTTWDLDGNVYNTYWDELDPTYSDATPNSVTWTNA